MKIIINIDTSNSAFWSDFENDKFEYQEVEKILKDILPKIETYNYGKANDSNGNTVASFTVERECTEFLYC
jgi:hypothetical protein